MRPYRWQPPSRSHRHRRIRRTQTFPAAHSPGRPHWTARSLEKQIRLLRCRRGDAIGGRPTPQSRPWGSRSAPRLGGFELDDISAVRLGAEDHDAVLRDLADVEFRPRSSRVSESFPLLMANPLLAGWPRRDGPGTGRQREAPACPQNGRALLFPGEAGTGHDERGERGAHLRRRSDRLFRPGPPAHARVDIRAGVKAASNGAPAHLRRVLHKAGTPRSSLRKSPCICRITRRHLGS